jgi:hypothetical protein
MPFGSTSILDNFNRANESPVTGFTAFTGASQVTSNQYALNGGSVCSAYASGAGTFGPLHLEFYVSIPTKPGTNGVASVMAVEDVGASFDGYEARLTVLAGTDTWQLFRIDNGTATQIGSTVSLEAASGDGIGIRLVRALGDDQVITLWRRSSGTWTPLLSVIENTYKTNAKYAGLVVAGSTVRLDDLGGGNLTATDVFRSDPDLISLWLMEEVSGNRADEVGPNDLTDNATVASSTDVKEGSRSADFERSNSEYLDIADASQTGLAVTGSFSVVAWIKRESASGGANHTVVSKFDPTGNQRGYLLGIGTADILRAIVSNDGTATTTLTGNLALATARWYHLALVYNGSSLTLYLDGTQEATVSYSSGIFDNTTAFAIGRSFGATDYFDGLVDEVGFLDRALSEAEVLGIFAEGVQAGNQYNFAATVTVASATPDAALTVSRTLSVTTAWQAATPDASLNAARALAATAGIQTLTPDAALTIARLLAVASDWQTETPDAELTVGALQLAAAIAMQAATPDATLTVARQFAATSSWQTVTPDANLTTGLVLAAAIGIQTTTPAAALTVARTLASANGWQAITPNAALSVSRPLVATLAWQVETSEANLASLVSLASVVAWQASTPAAALTVSRQLQAAVAWQAETGGAVMTLVILFSAASAWQAVTPAASLDTGVLAAGRVTVAFSAKVPGVSFAAKKPTITFGGE